MKAKVLVTGASGFVGKKILENLITDSNLSVSVLVRHPERVSYLQSRGVEIYEGDITKRSTLKDALNGKNAVIHCAALMSNFDSQPRDKFYETNVVGTENLLNSCDTSTLGQFIHISTTGVYGVSEEKPVSEEAPTRGVLSVYEWSKKEAEGVILKYARERSIPFTILRPSQLYGSGMTYGWPETIESIKLGRMYIPGKGSAKIHLLNIDDLVCAVRLALFNAKAKNGIYNIAGKEILSIGEVFGIISEGLGVNKPRKAPYLPVYISAIFLSLIPDKFKSKRLKLLTPHRVEFFSTDHIYDITKARQDLGYEPRVDLRSGFHEMIKWCERERLT